MALWYQGNVAMYDEERMIHEPPTKQDFKTRKLHLLGRYEKDFDGWGHGQWKPSERLIEKGYSKDKDS